MTQVVPLPEFDITFALAVSLVHRRYCERLDKRLREDNGTVFQKAIMEHVTAIQRLAEGFVAFETTGVSDELVWLSRPVMAIFASQCLLQFGHVKHHSERRAMTNDEKAHAYYTHSEACRLRILEKRPDWSGYALDKEGREAVKNEIRAKLNMHGYKWEADQEWHRHDSRSAYANGLKSLPKQMKDVLKPFEPMMDMLLDHINLGMHGAAYTRQSMHKNVSPGVALLEDDRTPKVPQNSDFAMVLASLSLQALAHEYGEGSLIMPMIESAHTDPRVIAQSKIGHFPTATVRMWT